VTAISLHINNEYYINTESGLLHQSSKKGKSWLSGDCSLSLLTQLNCYDAAPRGERVIPAFNFNFWLGWHSHVAVFNVETQIPVAGRGTTITLNDFWMLEETLGRCGMGI